MAGRNKAARGGEGFFKHRFFACRFQPGVDDLALAIKTGEPPFHQSGRIFRHDGDDIRRENFTALHPVVRRLIAVDLLHVLQNLLKAGIVVRLRNVVASAHTRHPLKTRGRLTGSAFGMAAAHAGISSSRYLHRAFRCNRKRSRQRAISSYSLVVLADDDPARRQGHRGLKAVAQAQITDVVK